MKMDEKQKQQTESQPVVKPESSGNLNAALTYVVGWITGLIFLLTEKEDKFIRFHAAQSFVTFGALTIILWIPAIGQLFGIILAPIGFILWIFLMVKAYQGERYELPFISKYAEMVEQKVGK